MKHDVYNRNGILISLFFGHDKVINECSRLANYSKFIDSNLIYFSAKLGTIDKLSKACHLDLGRNTVSKNSLRMKIDAIRQVLSWSREGYKVAIRFDNPFRKSRNGSFVHSLIVALVACLGILKIYIFSYLTDSKQTLFCFLTLNAADKKESIISSLYGEAYYRMEILHSTSSMNLDFLKLIKRFLQRNFLIKYTASHFAIIVNADSWELNSVLNQDIANLEKIRDFSISTRSQNIIASVFTKNEELLIKIGGNKIKLEYDFIENANNDIGDFIPSVVNFLKSVDDKSRNVTNIAIYEYADARKLSSIDCMERLIDIVYLLLSYEKYLREIKYFSGSNPQHCDFCVNNLLFNDDTIIVIDWEDVGSISDIGFDFNILVSSILQFDARRIYDAYLCGSSEKLMNALEVYTENHQIFEFRIRASLIRHLRTFLHLKAQGGYGEAIQGILISCISELEELIASSGCLRA